MNQDTGYSRKDGVQSNYIPFLPSPLADAYAKFNAGLTPQQRAELGASEHNPTGEIRPHYKDELCVSPRDYPMVGSGQQEGQGNLSNIFIEALTCHDPIPLSPEEIQSQTSRGHIHILVVFTIIRRVMRIFECAGDPVTRLHGDVVALALGLPGYTVGNIARAHHCTRQAVSKRLRKVIQALDLPPTYRMQMAADRSQGMDYKRHGKPPRKPRKAAGDAKGSPVSSGTTSPPHKPATEAIRNSGAPVGQFPVKARFQKNRCRKQG